MSVRSFRDVWQMGMDLVDAAYTLTRTFPEQERYGLTSQIRRAAVSVPSNIAEGHTRQHRKGYTNYLSMARASLAELDTQLEITARLKYVTADAVAPVQQQIESLGKQLRALLNALAKSRQP